MPHTHRQSDTPIHVRLEADDLAPKNFTTHLSRLDEEGRRNRPRDPSPKKTKKRHSKEHREEAERRRTTGALEPFFSKSAGSYDTPKA